MLLPPIEEPLRIPARTGCGLSKEVIVTTGPPPQVQTEEVKLPLSMDPVNLPGEKEDDLI
jgi:hypothetical protein